MYPAGSIFWMCRVSGVRSSDTYPLLIRPLVVDNGPDYFREQLARYRDAGKVGFFAPHGKIAVPPKYDYAMPFSEGRAAVCESCAETQEGEHRAVRGGRWGYIDRRGRLAIPLRFEEAGSFENGRARVRLGGAWRYIRTDGSAAPGKGRR